MAHDVFISYASVNRTAAVAACARLEEASIRCWIAPRDVEPGTPWPAAIVRAIDDCRVLVLIFSSAANKSEDVQREVHRAFGKEIPVLPLRVEDTKPSDELAYYLDRVHWLDALTEPLEQHLQKLVISVQALLGVASVEAGSRNPSYRRVTRPEEPSEAEIDEMLRQAQVFATEEATKREEVEDRHAAEMAEARALAEERRRWTPVAVEVGLPERGETRVFTPGRGQYEWFKDFPAGPEMVVVPSGRATIGSPASELDRDERLEAQRLITIERPFAVGRYAVTRGEYAAFCAAQPEEPTPSQSRPSRFWGPKKTEKILWRDPGFPQDDRHPVVYVSWNDAKDYVAWLKERTGKPYRLLSEAEWEYVARADTTTAYWWGDLVTPSHANFNYYVGVQRETEALGQKGKDRSGTMPVGSFLPNAWGLYEVHGNTYEWCEDVTDLGGKDGIIRRITRGGRSAARRWSSPDSRQNSIGFRIARTLVVP